MGTERTTSAGVAYSDCSATELQSECYRLRHANDDLLEVLQSVQRMWINQPSTLQPHHSLHGQRVLAMPEPKSVMWRVYFLSGDVVSQQIPESALSPGWPIECPYCHKSRE